MSELRFANLGTGFCAGHQLAGGRALLGARCVTPWNRTRAKAQALADALGIASVYDSPDELLAPEKLNFVDIITDVGTHRQFVKLAAAHRQPVVCQKPMVPTLADAAARVAGSRKAGETVRLQTGILQTSPGFWPKCRFLQNHS